MCICNDQAHLSRTFSKAFTGRAHGPTASLPGARIYLSRNVVPLSNQPPREKSCNESLTSHFIFTSFRLSVTGLYRLVRIYQPSFVFLVILIRCSFLRRYCASFGEAARLGELRNNDFYYISDDLGSHLVPIDSILSLFRGLVGDIKA